jgi:hypothetical protein
MEAGIQYGRMASTAKVPGRAATSGCFDQRTDRPDSAASRVRLGFPDAASDDMLAQSTANREEDFMGKLVGCPVIAASIVALCSLMPIQAQAFGTAPVASSAVDAISTVERTVCRAYPWWYPRRWAVYASAWPCYPSYSYYYYPRYPYYYYRRDPHVEPGFIRRSF